MSRALVVLDTEFQRRRAADWCWAAKNGSRVEFKGPKRTLDQNSLMWALLTDVALHMRKAAGLEYSTEEWKHIFLHGWGREVRFLPALDGKGVVPIPQSSSDLSKEEMADFIEYILKEGGDRGVSFNQQDPSVSGDEPDSEEGAPESSSPVEEANPSTSVPSSLTLTADDREFLVRVFRALREAVGPDVDVLKRQAIIFKEEIAGKSDLVKAKASTIRTKLEECCGEEPSIGTVAAGKYLAGVIGVEERELVL